MKLSLTKKGYSLTGMSGIQIGVINYLLSNMQERCFKEKSPGGDWYSGDDFLALLTDDEYVAFQQIVSNLNSEVSRITG